MKWQDKLAVLKLAGFDLYENPAYSGIPEHEWRYFCDKFDPYDLGVGDTQEDAVNDAWNDYMKRFENEKAS